MDSYTRSRDQVEYYEALKRNEGVPIYIHRERPPGYIIPERRKRESEWQAVCSRMCRISRSIHSRQRSTTEQHPMRQDSFISTSSGCLEERNGGGQEEGLCGFGTVHI